MAVPIQNPHFATLSPDYLYHLGLDSSMDLVGMFSDVKFVCMGGSAPRAEAFAKMLARELTATDPDAVHPIGKTERYSLFKVGPVISVNHGMGMPSHSILMHEITKLLRHANATNVIFIRIGTSGGIGVEPGTIVVAEEAINNELKPVHRAVILGTIHEFPTTLDKELCQEVLAAAKGTEGERPVPCVLGKTMGTDDFYEGQGRMDGALCEFTYEEQRAWIARVSEAGVTNMEMEGPQFAAFCARLGIRAVLMCGVLVNRLLGDQVTSTPQELAQVGENVLIVALRFIKNRLAASAH